MLLAAVAQGQQSYTVTNLPGWNLIANQLNGPNANALASVIPSAPLNSRIIRYNQTNGTIQNATMTAGGGWLPSGVVLNPGDGLEFSNASAANFVMTFSGSSHVPVLPANLGFNLLLLARQTNGIGNITNILGYNPPNKTILYQFIPGPGHDPSIFVPSNYTIYALTGGAWTTPPGPPTNIHVGESVWITTNGALPAFDIQPQGGTYCPSNTLFLNAIANGSLPITYQWFLNGNPIAQATNPTYTVFPVRTNDSGTYVLKATNPLGTTSTSNAVVVAGDTIAPVLTCPSNRVVGCRGPSGTTVSYVVGITDNCDQNPILVCTPPSGSVFPFGTTTVVCRGSDSSGNTNTCTFTITVVDQKPPVLRCPPDRVVVATSSQGAAVYYNVAAADDCDNSPNVICTPPSGSIFPIGTTTVTCVGTDSSGNSSTCSFNVIVVAGGCCDRRTWRNGDVSSPGGRFGHSMAYDSGRGRIVLFGGVSSSGLLRDTWEWDGSNWTFMTSNGPSARAFSAMAYDAKQGLVLLFGGDAGVAGKLGDTWAWDGSSWQQLNPSSSPAARGGHAMAFDLARNRTVLFGGQGSDSIETGDTWEYDGVKWLPMNGGSQAPSARLGHVMAYGSSQGQMLLFGGTKQGNYFGDTWKWNGNTWTQIASNGPSARAFAAMTYNDNCDTILLHGGSASAASGLSDTWEWDGNGWSLTASNTPSARYQHAMAHDSAAGRTVLFGGTRDGKSWLGDTYFYNGDQTPAQVRDTYVACGEQRVVISFSKSMDPVSVQNPNNYTILCGNNTVPIVSVKVSDDSRIVFLTASQPFTGSLAGAGCCTLLIDGVRDACGNPMRGYQTSVCCTNEPCLKGSAGTEYWLTFPGNYAPDPTNPPAPQLFIGGAAGTFGAVVMPGITPPFLTFFAIPASGVAVVTLPAAADLADANDLVQSNAVRVVASRPVSVYGYNHIRYTTDAYLGLSTKALGQTYLVAAYKNVFNGVPELNGVQFAVAATTNDTKVVIVPSAAVGAHPAYVPFLLTMNRGETYQLRDTNDAPADLTGSIVVADQPIAVFGGHQCANIPSSNTFFCDYVVEQMPPTENWGNNFITVPLAGRVFGDTFHIMALFNNTSVQVNGAPLPGTIDQGKFYELQLAAAYQITSDKPVLVAQFSDSSDFDGVSYSDPFMVLLPPTPLYSTSYILEAPTTDFPTNYVNISTPAAGVGQITLDGVVIPAGSYSAVAASGYSVARVPVSVGPHSLASGNGVAFGVVAYGWGLYDSYGYPGGTCNRPLGQPRPFTCPQSNVVVTAASGCVGIVPDLTSQVGNGSSAVVILQEPPAGTALPPGVYGIKVTIVDQFGGRQICNSSLTVLPPSGAGLICPRNINTNCASTNGQYVFFNVGTCNSNYPVTVKPPSGSLFPIGQTVVSCTASNVNGQVEQCSFIVNVDCAVVSVVQLTPSDFTINWTGTGVLQKATDLNGPWITISNAVPPYRVFTSGGRGFFRVKQQ